MPSRGLNSFIVVELAAKRNLVLKIETSVCMI